MDERYNAAMDKVRDEMAERGEGPAGVGEIVTDLLPQMPALAEAVLKEGKTLSDCYKTLEKYAREHKRGSCYYMPPGEAMRLICEYYGVEAGAVTVPTGDGPHPSQPAAVPPSPKGEGDLIRQPCGPPPSPKGEGFDTLDDLLEGL